MKQGKYWGETTKIYTGENCEVHYLNIKAGGFCSIHLHQTKWNRFYVISGTLKISIFRDGDKEEVYLSDGEITDIPPGVQHQFFAPNNCRCLEVYWTDALDPNDITRFSVGGIKK